MIEFATKDHIAITMKKDEIKALLYYPPIQDAAEPVCVVLTSGNLQYRVDENTYHELKKFVFKP